MQRIPSSSALKRTLQQTTATSVRALHQQAAAVTATASSHSALAAATAALSAASKHGSGCACCSRPALRSAATAASASSSSSFLSSHPPRSSSSLSRFSSSISTGPLMKAQVLTSASDPSFTMGLEELVRPRPGPGEVLVKVRACGVCHTDLHVMKSEVAFPLPAVMGHEISGDIVELGAGVASSYASVQLKVGQAVTGVFILPCGTCTPCVRGDEDLCATFFAYNRGYGHLYDGSTRLHRPDGTPIAMYSMAGLAEYAVLPATAVHPLPASYSTGTSYVNSSIVGCAVFTAYGAVHNVACLRSGESVAVLGVGGVGANVIQLARAQNADRIIAVDISEEKLALARQMGATHTINASAAATKGGKVDVAEELRAFTDGRGVDVAFEALGRADTFVQAIGGLRDGGRAVMVGIAPAGVTAAVDITRLVRRKLQVLGSYGARARKDLPAIMRLLERGQIRIDEAVSRRFSLAQAGEAYKLLNEGKIIGRAVIDMQL